MSSDVIGVRAEITTNRIERGTVCCCDIDCPDPIQCSRDRRAAESTWIADARRPVNWGVLFETAAR